MVNRSRFQAETSALSPPINTQALSYAAAALGALTSAEYVGARERCYNQARELLDLCERQDSGGMLVSINALQTCVLLALYEFKSPNFARLWMTLGRAIRLSKMMGMDLLDADRSSTSESLSKEPPQLPFQLPPASSPAVLEERRRTFWILYIFDVSASIRSPSVRPAFDASQVIRSISFVPRVSLPQFPPSPRRPPPHTRTHRHIPSSRSNRKANKHHNSQGICTAPGHRRP